MFWIELSFAALDVLVKILYSIILLSSNIFILDIVADVRMIQVLLFLPYFPFCKVETGLVGLGSCVKMRTGRKALRSGRRW